MTNTATFKVQYPDWERAFNDWAIVCRMGIVDAWRYQAKNIASALVLGYEPSGRKDWNESTPPNVRKQGEYAVERDIRRAIFPLRAEGFKNPKLRKKISMYVRNEDATALEAMLTAGTFGSEFSHLRIATPGTGRHRRG